MSEATPLFYLHHLPTWFPMAGITLGKHIFLKNLDDEVILQHELVHVRQQTEHPIWFWFSYLFFPLPLFWSWRWKWELEAYQVQLDAGRMTPESVARMLSGSLYLWPCRKKTVLAHLDLGPKS